MSAPPVTSVRIIDTTLRDGSHAVSHSFTAEQVAATARALSAAGVGTIEVSHGDGLRGSSFNYGFGRADDLQLIAAAVTAAPDACIACLLLPGIGTADDLRAAADRGAGMVRIATHCTEADIAIQHLGIARELGLETVGFLMLSHMSEPRDLAAQARILADAGAQCVYVVDSAGALVPSSVVERVTALRDELSDDARVGFHAHNNMGLAIGNSMAAIEAGATYVDGSTCGLGAGAGNAATELLIAALERQGIETGVQLTKILDASQDVVRPISPRDPTPNRDEIILGYAGVYSSFLLHAQRAGERYGVPAHEILLEAGRRSYVGGQEDMLIDVAMSLSGATADAGDHDAR